MNAATDTTCPTAKQIAIRRRVALTAALAFVESQTASGIKTPAAVNLAETMDEADTFDPERLAEILRFALEL